MKYNIYSYRYISDMTYVTTKYSHADAVTEIERLAKERDAKPKSWFSGDPVHYTFLPEA